jgi:hypothetical protein
VSYSSKSEIAVVEYTSNRHSYSSPAGYSDCSKCFAIAAITLSSKTEQRFDKVNESNSLRFPNGNYCSCGNQPNTGKDLREPEVLGFTEIIVFEG